MLNGDFSAILLSKQCPNDRAFLLAEGMSRNVVRDCEENQWVECHLEARVRGLLGGDQGIWGVSRHDAVLCTKGCRRNRDMTDYGECLLIFGGKTDGKAESSLNDPCGTAGVEA
jgi:hypothetical protein